MQKRVFISLSILSLLFAIASCKKDTTAPLGNNPHAITNDYFLRAKFDTTWTYFGTENKDECQSSQNVCGFLRVTYFNYANFSFQDSANKNPQDSVIRGWKGKSFRFYSATDSLMPYQVSFTYPDSTGAIYSTVYANNTQSMITVDSVVYDGLSTLSFDTANVAYKCYKVKGSISCNLGRFNDTIHMMHLTQGLYSVRVMEAKR